MSIGAIAVVVPARNEERNIRACIDSIAGAARRVELPTLPLVVDHCSSDRTAEIVDASLSALGGRRLRCRGATVGEVRATGVRWALRRLGDLDAACVWLAFTDADSRVPADWLERQLQWADSGVDGVVGLVRLPERDRFANATYEAFYDAGVWVGGHDHVHGANMGVRASAYQAVGGFAPVGTGEDVDLWTRLRAAGGPLACDEQLVVETSARRAGRAKGGLADVLAVMAGV